MIQFSLKIDCPQNSVKRKRTRERIYAHSRIVLIQQHDNIYKSRSNQNFYPEKKQTKTHSKVDWMNSKTTEKFSQQHQKRKKKNEKHKRTIKHSYKWIVMNKIILSKRIERKKTKKEIYKGGMVKNKYIQKPTPLHIDNEILQKTFEINGERSEIILHKHHTIRREPTRKVLQEREKRYKRRKQNFILHRKQEKYMDRLETLT